MVMKLPVRARSLYMAASVIVRCRRCPGSYTDSDTLRSCATRAGVSDECIRKGNLLLTPRIAADALRLRTTSTSAA